MSETRVALMLVLKSVPNQLERIRAHNRHYFRYTTKSREVKSVKLLLLIVAPLSSLSLQSIQPRILHLLVAHHLNCTIQGTEESRHNALVESRDTVCPIKDHQTLERIFVFDNFVSMCVRFICVLQAHASFDQKQGVCDAYGRDTSQCGIDTVIECS